MPVPLEALSSRFLSHTLKGTLSNCLLILANGYYSGFVRNDSSLVCAAVNHSIDGNNAKANIRCTFV